MGRASATHSSIGDAAASGVVPIVNNIVFDPNKGELDVASGHRRWVHEAIERRIKKAMASGTLDLSSPPPSSLVDGNRALHLHLLPRELYLSVSRFAWAKQHLTKLFLTNNCLSLLAPQVVEFSQLTVLGVGGNALASLPADMGLLVHLEQLVADNNQLTCLPDSLRLCTKLQVLSLGGNALTEFPLVVTKCTKLLQLNLSHNRLTSLPVHIRSLARLVDLDLDHNRIGPTLPDEVTYLRRLERLGLAGNCLAATPTCLKALPLTCLRLSGNRAPGYVVKDPLTGDVIDGVNTPVRFDGYMQLRHAYTALSDETQETSHKVEDIPGLVPATLQNLENAFRDRDRDNIGRKILRGRNQNQS
ncbi:Aste57867_15108 [Aphanomyces stellatus]|uniref:Aste57867_15108 protein n=1 Tax=Aphanomyces stellatus TaxID=120398 RepID=A0A485L2F5_9STRA|nr:hypothetical protein As57867_015052 [Aphanomyces stellatus]VFT91921.1 Aste57867_15108 [Aphanomyces stellatus]